MAVDQTTVGLLVGGLVLLMIGGELAVRGGIAAAVNLGVPTVVVGIVLLGFGTSLPELVTSLQASLHGSPGIAVGNVVGSNISNLLLVAGLAALLTHAPSARMMLIWDGSVMMIATIAFVALMYLDLLVWQAGAALLGALAVYLIVSVIHARRAATEAPPEVIEARQQSPRLAASLGLFGLGLVATLIGANLLVDGAIDLARALGASEALIGVTIVAIGTSLPELAATISAAIRGRVEMAIGNVFGSNIFNILAIIGTTVMVRPLDVPQEILRLDMWAMLLATALVLIFARTWSRLSRGEGLVLLIGYAVYIGLTVSLGS